MIAKRELAIKCGDGLRPVIFAIRDNEIWLLRLRNGFSQTIAKTRYDLSSGRETTFNLYKNTVEKEFTRVKLIAYDKESYFTKLKDIIESNQQQFEANQSGLWDFLWDRFRESVDGEAVPPFNTNIWRNHVLTCKRFFL